MHFFLVWIIFPVVYCNVPRLSKNVVPTNYNLTLITHLPGYGYQPTPERNLTYEGELHIDLELSENLDNITIHAADNIVFNIENCKIVNSKNGKTVAIKNITESDLFQQVTIVFEQSVQKGSFVLILQYESIFSQGLRGFYISPYTNQQSKLAAVTQFEALSARSAIPCFDEPAIKATWDITIIHPEGTHALSNGKEISTKPANKSQFLVTRFEKTPKMSSYLLAFVISAMEYNEIVTKSGLRIRLYTSKTHSKRDINFALKTAAKTFEYFENIFGIKFPIRKVDIVGLILFESGGMENWGLITFFEEELFVMDEFSMKLLTHEIAHQWFGNLVTMEWWTETWLNEGFADFYEILGAHNISNGKYDFEQNIGELSYEYLDYHSTPNTIGFETPTIVPEFKTLKEVESVFSLTTYTKGGAIINMFRDAIGHLQFDEGIKRYLKANAYSSTNSSVLYDYFKMPQGNGPSSVSDFLDPWLNQVGHPLITIDQYNDTHNILTQSRFDNGNILEIDKHFNQTIWNYQWDILVEYEISLDEVGKVWLLKNSTAYIPRHSTLNPRAIGIYAVLDKTEITDVEEIDSPDHMQTKLSNIFEFWRNGRISRNKNEKVFQDSEKLWRSNRKIRSNIKAQSKIVAGQRAIQNYKNIRRFRSNRKFRKGRMNTPKYWSTFEEFVK